MRLVYPMLNLTQTKKKIQEEFIVESMFKMAISFLIPSSIIIFTLQSISYNNSGQNTLSV